jgi:hypothetical protein
MNRSETYRELAKFLIAQIPVLIEDIRVLEQWQAVNRSEACTKVADPQEGELSTKKM